jgi:alpha-amylase
MGCSTKHTIPAKIKNVPFIWENATVYFLLTDRFYNADPTNDFIHPVPPAPYRGFMGGDIKGITSKIKEGYFDKLGVNAIWMTPLVENIATGVDEGTGLSYGFHGYWTKDWTKTDSRLGTEKDITDMINTAHKHGIRVLMDAVINHTGPVTASDIKWPDDWVRTGPKCTYTGYESTIACTLTDNLPDIRTESKNDVEIPLHLAEKWKKEGRYDKEVAELKAFFVRTEYPRRPYYYIIKWLTDLVRKFGIDGFRVDTVKHTEEEVWKTLQEESSKAFADWKKAHPADVSDDHPFFMVGEVYNYYIGAGRDFNFGDRKVDYYSNGFDALINFDFKYDAKKPVNELSEKYDNLLHGPLKGKSVMNYISSHDDDRPFDRDRKMSKESGTKLLLSPGIAQIYYGDESGRSLSVKASGDATLRSFMNWDEQNQADKKLVLEHWQKLGQFRKNHPAIGAGMHHSISRDVFARTLPSWQDTVVCAVNQNIGFKTVSVAGYFKEGQTLTDFYSGQKVKIKGAKIELETAYDIVLLYGSE